MTVATVPDDDTRMSDSSPEGALCRRLWRESDGSSPPARHLADAARKIVVFVPSHEEGGRSIASGVSTTAAWGWGLSTSIRDVEFSIQLDVEPARSETEKIKQDPELMQAIRQSREAIDEGRVHSEEEAHEMIGW